MDLILNENLLAVVVGVGACVFAGLKKMSLVRKLKLDKVVEFIEAGVQITYENYVRVLKNSREDGKLTAAERSYAVNKALEHARTFAAKEGINMLNYYSQEYLPVLVEKIVSERKAGKVTSAENKSVES